MGNYDSTPIAKSDRIKRLVDHLYAKMPEIEAARAELITESFKATDCLLYTAPSPRDRQKSRMPSSA